jgi:heptosyltransferase-2
MAAGAQRCLVVAPSWLGDAVLARPAVAALAAAGCSLEVLARGRLGRVLEDLPGVRRVHVVPAASRRQRLRAAVRLRGTAWDGAVVLAPSFSAALAARLAGARIRVGERGQLRDRLLTRALPSAPRTEHLARSYLRLAAALCRDLGLVAAPEPDAGQLSAPGLALRPEERHAATALLARHRIAGTPLVVAPGARYGPAKRYPAERFAAAAVSLAERLGAPVVVVGEAADAPATAAVAAALPGAVDLAGRTSLEELLGILAASCAVLANDSGTMHVAAALGCRVVGVFGSTSPAWTGPLGPQATTVSRPVWCSPCFAATCAQDFACMLDLAPQALVDAFVGLEGRGAGPAPPREAGL